MDELLSKILKDSPSVGLTPRSLEEVKGDMLFSKDVAIAKGELAELRFNSKNKEFYVTTTFSDIEITEDFIGTLEQGIELALDYTSAIQLANEPNSGTREERKKSLDDIISSCIEELKSMGYRCESSSTVLGNIKLFKADSIVGETDTSRIMYNPKDKKFRAITTQSNIKVTDEVLEDFELSSNLADKFNVTL